MITAAFVATSGHIISSQAIHGKTSLCAARSSLRGRPLFASKPFSTMVPQRSTWEMKIGILFSTVTGNTEEVAGVVKKHLGDEAADPVEIDSIKPEALKDFDALIVGAPTWNTGADVERSGTGWDEFLLNELPNLDLGGKPVGVFGLGDSGGYGDNFCDAIEEMHDGFQNAGATMVGYVDPSAYDFDESKSVRDGKFLGLPLDQVNEDDLTEDRVKTWCAQVMEEAGLPAPA